MEIVVFIHLPMRSSCQNHIIGISKHLRHMSKIPFGSYTGKCTSATLLKNLLLAYRYHDCFGGLRSRSCLSLMLPLFSQHNPLKVFGLIKIVGTTRLRRKSKPCQWDLQATFRLHIFSRCGGALYFLQLPLHHPCSRPVGNAGESVNQDSQSASQQSFCPASQTAAAAPCELQTQNRQFPRQSNIVLHHCFPN